ncbi:hypothetical protein BJ546DRAFT_960895 [Cryomyces antarcticus]|uniref:Translocation protein sec72 n=1 Tax=Cryomyces antarcticus TaxID=329879 RepID=A0ABR0KW28_9PEZI|nr:hypothetical protein LTR39_000625 [Cryomyces antarcticus]KAK5019568.1 hypothetical protein LTR60_001078 [Cryomyces antarcticus]KAK5131008.1 hypothetical protein LTR16_001133 [Cryomyces antarcticus]KAK5162559.1 hypothetical protein LTR04_003417 [Oleoguttula sp. CCFEE 6159]
MADVEAQETFIQLPIQIDPSTKAVTSASTSSSTALDAELKALNTLHRSLLALDTPNSVPPPPVPVNPKRSAQIGKLRDSGNSELRKGKHADAIRMYSLGIEMAQGRPPWEPAGLVREELSALYSNRAQAYMGMQAWPEGAIDAECSTELKRVGNAKAWWRRGRCLVEMGRLEEAKEWVARAIDFENGEQELKTLLEEIEKNIESKRR